MNMNPNPANNPLAKSSPVKGFSEVGSKLVFIGLFSFKCTSNLSIETLVVTSDKPIIANLGRKVKWVLRKIRKFSFEKEKQTFLRACFVPSTIFQSIPKSTVWFLGHLLCVSCPHKLYPCL